jgi:antitoxin FitA
MASMTLKNIPENLHEQLKRSADENHRSLNKEAMVCLQRGLLQSKRIDVEAFLRETDKMREWTKDAKITWEEIDRAKRLGRP